MQRAQRPRATLSPRPTPRPPPGASTDAVVVVAQEALASAALAWKERAERLLAANARLKDRVAEVEASHRKSLTVVKNVPALPNNHVFTKQLVDENHALRQETRALQHRLMQMEGQGASGKAREFPGYSRRPHSAKEGKPRPAAAASTATATAASQTTGGGMTTQDTEASNTRTVEGSASSSCDVAPVCTSLVQELKTHLQTLEVDLERLRRENELLRGELEQKEQDHPKCNHQGRKDVSCSSPEQDSAVAMTTKGFDQKELLDCVAAQLQQMKVLEARYQHLESKAQTKQTLYEENMARLEEVNSQLFDAQQRIAAQAEKIQGHVDQSALLEDLQREMHLLRRDNLTLNETTAALSSRPFDTLSKDLQKKNLWLLQLEDEKKRIEEDRARVQQDCIVTRRTNEKLRGRVQALAAEASDLAKRLSKAETETEQQKMEKEVAQLQLRFYMAPGDKTLMTAVGKALKEMRKQERKFQSVVPESDDEATTTSPNTTTDDHSTGDQHGVIAAPTNFVCSVCLANNESVEVGTLQRERLLKISELSTLMQDDAMEQIRSLKFVHKQEVQALRRELQRSEKRVAAFLEQIALLQREKREILDQRRSTRINSPRVELPAAAVSAPKPQQPSSSDSLPPSLASGSNDTILEMIFTDLHVTFDFDGASQLPSFVLACDYYDFEPQVSPVLTPQVADTNSKRSSMVPIDFGITFKLDLNLAFLRLPLSRLAVVELQRINIGNAKVVAVATVPLDSLFLSEGGQVQLALKLVSPYNQASIGTLRAEMRLSHPVDHTFKAIMRENKTSTALIDAETRYRLVHPARNPAAPKSELGIRIISLILTKTFVTRMQPSYCESSGDPDFCLNYRFMGFPSTSIEVNTSTTAVTGGCYFLGLNHGRAFEISSSKDFLEFLRKYKLEVRICEKLSRTSTQQSSGKHQSTSGEYIGVGHAPFHDLIQLASVELSSSALGTGSCPPTSILCSSLGLYDTSDSSRLHGRLAVELSFNGISRASYSSGGLTIPTTQLWGGMASLFITEGSELVDWSKFCRVMELTPLDRSTRQLILDKCQPMALVDSSKSGLSVGRGKYVRRLVSHVKNARTQATNQDALESWDTARKLFAEAGLHFHRMDIVAIFSGLRTSTEGCNANLEVGSAVAATSRLWNKLELLCETCQDKWMRVEGPLRDRVQALGLLRPGRATDTTSAKQITWEEFLRRLKVHQGSGV